jgi:hypothetical protein
VAQTEQKLLHCIWVYVHFTSRIVRTISVGPSIYTECAAAYSDRVLLLSLGSEQ